MRIKQLLAVRSLKFLILNRYRFGVKRNQLALNEIRYFKALRHSCWKIFIKSTITFEMKIFLVIE